MVGSLLLSDSELLQYRVRPELIASLDSDEAMIVDTVMKWCEYIAERSRQHEPLRVNIIGVESDGAHAGAMEPEIAVAEEISDPDSASSVQRMLCKTIEMLVSELNQMKDALEDTANAKRIAAGNVAVGGQDAISGLARAKIKRARKK